LTPGLRILYIGDVPVESTTGGEMLLYKLLEQHEPRDLLIVQAKAFKEVYEISKNATLPGVRYETFQYPRLYGARIAFTHYLNNLVSFWLTARWKRKISIILKEFKPDIILSVGHNFLWHRAYQLSVEHNIPFYIICHDELKGTISSKALASSMERHFHRAYSNSKGAFCVSDYMVEEYEKRYGKRGEVLFPIGVDDLKLLDQLSNIAKEPSPGLNIGYAGSLWNDYADNLIALAHALAPIGGRVVAYANRDLKFLRSRGLTTDNVEVNSFIPVRELLVALKQRCDVLYLPMDFNEIHRPNISIAFPSKTGDYAALGLPILVHAPAYASIVRWAESNNEKQFAEIVTSLDSKSISAALQALTSSQHRSVLGANALAIWHSTFDPEIVRSKFYRAIA
jgi:glycosyltransferase involved in cell wall biosynthesis